MDLSLRFVAIAAVVLLSVIGCSPDEDGGPQLEEVEITLEEPGPTVVDAHDAANGKERAKIEIPDHGAGIAGTVDAVPACSLTEPQCGMPIFPMEAEVIVREDGFLWFTGDEVARTRSNEDGQFVVSLGPGGYVVTAVSEDDDCDEHAVHVTSEEFTHVQLECIV